MVYGNMGDDCATGVAFTAILYRQKQAVWRVLVNAQGEDVVAGIHAGGRIAAQAQTAQGIQGVRRGLQSP